MNSGGVSPRVPLYAGYRSVRNVPPGRSNATATCVGLCFVTSDSIIDAKPYTALTGSPVDVRKFSAGRAKNARKAMEKPSIRRRLRCRGSLTRANLSRADDPVAESLATA